MRAFGVAAFVCVVLAVMADPAKTAPTVPIPAQPAAGAAGPVAKAPVQSALSPVAAPQKLAIGAALPTNTKPGAQAQRQTPQAQDPEDHPDGTNTGPDGAPNPPESGNPPGNDVPKKKPALKPKSTSETDPTGAPPLGELPVPEKVPHAGDETPKPKKGGASEKDDAEKDPEKAAAHKQPVSMLDDSFVINKLFTPQQGSKCATNKRIAPKANCQKDNTCAYTYTFWVRFKLSWQSGRGNLFQKGAASAAQKTAEQNPAVYVYNTQQVWYMNDNRLDVVSGHEKDRNFGVSVSNLPSNKWLHFALTHKNGEFILFRDGVIVSGPTNIGAPILNENDLWCSNSWDRESGVDMADFRYYDTVLAQDVIQEIRTARKLPETELVRVGPWEPRVYGNPGNVLIEPNDAVLTSAQYGYSFWLRRTSDTARITQSLWARGYPPDPAVLVLPNWQIQAQTDSTGTHTHALLSLAADDKYHHMVITRRPGSFMIYWDNQVAINIPVEAGARRDTYGLYTSPPYWGGDGPNPVRLANFKFFDEFATPAVVAAEFKKGPPPPITPVN